MNHEKNDIRKGIENLSGEERFLLCDYLFTQKYNQFKHRPARSIREFIISPYYLNAAKEIWGPMLDVLSQYYASGKRVLNFNASIGAGKSFAAAAISCYELHKLLCLANPRQLFGLAKDANIIILNMSVSAEQARKVVFGNIKGLIDNSYWFNRFAQYNTDKLSELEFPGRTFVIPGNSSEKTPLGYNILSAILDEANFFININDANCLTAETIYQAIKRRIFSRFGSYGRLAVISSTNTVDDFTMRLEKDESVFSIRRILWEMKPELIGAKMVDIDGFTIPAEMIAEYKGNPEQFKRDFLNIPSQAIEPYFRDLQAIEAACIGKNLWDGKTLLDSQDYKRGDRFIHVDLGLKYDAAALACGYKSDGKLIIDILARIVAGNGGEVRIEQLRDIIFAIRRKGGRIHKVSFDGYQSADTLQQLNAKGYTAELLSVDRTLSPYDTLKTLIYEGNAILPNHDILKRELKRLELVKGKKVDHPRDGSKDCADAVAGVAFHTCASAPLGRVISLSSEEAKSISAANDKSNLDVQKSILDDIMREIYRGEK